MDINGAAASNGNNTTRPSNVTEKASLPLFIVDDRWTLILQGAEACIWKVLIGTYQHDFAVTVIAKEHFPVLDK